MADDWKPGDLALCVSDGRLDGWSTYGAIKKGRTYTALAFFVDQDGDEVLLLKEVRATNRHGAWLERRFIKVTPDEADEFDRETIALLTGKPAQVPA